MRVLLCFTILAASLASQSAFGALVVTEVMSTSNAPLGSSLDARDWWELTNSGPAPVSLNGYKWEDDSGSGAAPSGDVANFPNGITVGVNESIIILQTPGVSNAADFRTAWGLPASVQVLDDTQFTGPNIFSGLSSNGDQVNLFDASNVKVDNATFGPSTAGVSFEWSRTNVNLALSVAGQNGAYQITYPSSTNTAIGSPGVSTGLPEPMSLVLALVAAIGATFIRRR